MLVEGSLAYDGSGEHHEWTSASHSSNGTWSLMTENTSRNMIGIVADWKASASGSAVVRHEGGTNDGQITCGASRSVTHSEALC